MKSALPGLLLLAALLWVPFMLRPPQPEADEAARTLVVLTSHNDAIRYEMARGFQRYRRARGAAPVRIDWRSPGGTTEISRFLASEYRTAFELYWQRQHGRLLSEAGARAFSNPKQDVLGDGEPAMARREFLRSSIGIKIDVLFGGGSYDFSQHAAAGRLVDSGVLARHPDLVGEHAIPQVVGGEPYWDKQGRWVGACLSGFGICYNRDALTRLGIEHAPTAWADLADPLLAGHVALADPSKSGSANKAFEMLLQQFMAQQVERRGSPAAGSAEELLALTIGFDDGMRLVRKIAGNSRYFTDQAGKVAQDVQSGSAAVGMCIDFYGRFQSDAVGAARRIGFSAPIGGSSIGSDPIGLLRGAPAADLGRDLIDFVLSPEGQALWAYKRGAPNGPERYALRRMAILPAMYEPSQRELRSDPDDNPYENARSFHYHATWTAPLFRALSFVIRVMCVDTEVELHEAAEALAKAGAAPQARAAFDDMSLVSYPIVKARIAPALASSDPLREVELQNELVSQIKAHYEHVTDLARRGL
jgi:ABC-type Fe3+ transport system substrate-binding protein